MDAVFLKILNMSISSIWLILAVALMRLLLKKAPKGLFVALWGMAALKLCLPFSFESVLSLVPSGETVPQNIALSTSPAINSGVNVIDNAVNTVINHNFAPVDVTASVNPMQILIAVLSNVWFFGVLAMVIYCIATYVVLRGKVGASIKLKENIYICDSIPGPFILGVIRPRIYIPSDLEECQTVHIIAHERAHLKRLDNLWKPLGFIILAIHWFNPLVWLAYVLLCRDIEFACDERVVKTMSEDEIKAYSSTLLNCSVSKRLITACPVSFGEVGVKERIKSVLSYKKPVFWVLIIAVIASVGVGIFFLTNPPEDIKAPEGQSGNIDGQVWFEAIVLEESDSRLLVEPCPGTNERRSADRMSVKKPQNDGKKVTYGVKSLVKIYYDGMIQELYPAIIPNVYKIELSKEKPIDIKTNVSYTAERGFVKYVTDTKDPVYAKAINREEMQNGYAPVHRIDSYSQLVSFLEPYKLEYETNYGTGVIMYTFNEEYFEKHSVILVYSVSSNRLQNKVDKVAVNGGDMYITFTQMLLDSDKPLSPMCQFFAIGTEKKVLDGVKNFYADPAKDGNINSFPKPTEGTADFTWSAYLLDGKTSLDDALLATYVVDGRGRKLYKFDNHYSLQGVGDCFGDTNQYPDPVMRWHDYYDVEYFKTKTLFFIYIASPSGSISYEITGINVKSNGVAEIKLLTKAPEAQTHDMKYYGLAIEVDKKYIEGCSEFVLTEETNNEYAPQAGVTVVGAPEELMTLKIDQYYTQGTGILDKNEDIFTKAANKDLLNNTDKIHLPVHIIKNYDEYLEFIKQYEGVATVELPFGINASLGIGRFSFEHPKQYLAVVYIDPTMADRGVYNLGMPKVENGKMTFPVVCDGWYRGKIDLKLPNLGWLAAYTIPASEFEGVNQFDAVAFQTMDEYADVYGNKVLYYE